MLEWIPTHFWQCQHFGNNNFLNNILYLWIIKSFSFGTYTIRTVGMSIIKINQLESVKDFLKKQPSSQGLKIEFNGSTIELPFDRTSVVSLTVLYEDGSNKKFWMHSDQIIDNIRKPDIAYTNPETGASESL